jgi:hypothetical protein
VREGNIKLWFWKGGRFGQMTKLAWFSVPRTLVALLKKGAKILSGFSVLPNRLNSLVSNDPQPAFRKSNHIGL